MNQTENALALAGSIGGKNGLNCIAELDGTALEQSKAQEADKQTVGRIISVCSTNRFFAKIRASSP
jgi:hypothetical protein